MFFRIILIRQFKYQIIRKLKQAKSMSQQQQKLNQINKEQQQIISNKQQVQYIENINQNQIKKSQKDSLKQQMRAQLISMQFQKQYIQQAIKNTNNLQQAIQYIINKIQSLDEEKIKQQLSRQIKTFFIVRMDLKMGTGKIAAQVAHAALKSFQNMRYSTMTNDQRAGLLIQWIQKGKQTKILEVQNEKQLFEYLKKANQKNINTCYIRDAGRTQIAAGSTTVAAIGPVKQCDVSFLSQLEEL